MSFAHISLAALPFRLTVCGLEELADHSDREVSHVLSILDPSHPKPSAFQSYGDHARLELRFHDIISVMPEQDLPQPHHVVDILRFGRNILNNPDSCQHLLVHCHAGISRSTAAMTLFLAQAQPRLPASEILAQVVKIRANAWPNLHILHMGEEQLERPGEFTSAVASVYRLQLQRQPHLQDLLTNCGRAREVALGLGEPASAAS
jgi:predicted protein tyrosine phosphatase